MCNVDRFDSCYLSRAQPGAPIALEPFSMPRKTEKGIIIATLTASPT